MSHAGYYDGKILSGKSVRNGRDCLQMFSWVLGQIISRSYTLTQVGTSEQRWIPPVVPPSRADGEGNPGWEGGSQLAAGTGKVPLLLYCGTPVYHMILPMRAQGGADGMPSSSTQTPPTYGARSWLAS